MRYHKSEPVEMSTVVEEISAMSFDAIFRLLASDF